MKGCKDVGLPDSGCGWHIALNCISAIAEEVLLHLAGEVLARTRIGEVEAIFVDQHGLLLHPFGPCLLADLLPQPFTQGARVGREIQPFSFFSELDAVD